ncbi:PIG-L deacetylase family protein [Pelosinus sp. sgz500959]|uniref:PIG-L deacetylase family protein n=1 Tax=Pelosinus sp. sgz500959 TaxID=3242472 RepID=UPI0036704357
MRAKKILVIAAHPDDEVLGCGATMAKHVQAGDKVDVVILGEGITSRDNIRNREQHSKLFLELQQSAKRANDILGVSTVTFGTFPDNRMDSLDLLDVVKTIEFFIEKFNPDIVYTHHHGDVNVDHQIVNRAVITACRPLPGVKFKTILFFEVASSTEWQVPSLNSSFNPNWFVDVSDTVQLKRKALQAYQSEMREWPHPRSINAVEYLAKWRGATIGVEAAEAFSLGRHICGG